MIHGDGSPGQARADGTADATPDRRRGRLMLVGIFAVFAAPILIAWVMVFGPVDWQPVTTKNLGTLLRPPLPVAAEETSGRASAWPELGPGDWLVLGLGFEQCDPACEEPATALRNVRLANAHRADRVFLAAPAGLAPPEALPIESGLAEQLRSRLAKQDPALASASAVIVDFHLDAVLAYGQPFPSSALLKDLKRLVKAYKPE